MMQMLVDPAVRERYAAPFHETYASDTAQFMQHLRTDSQRFGQTVERLKISLIDPLSTRGHTT